MYLIFAVIDGDVGGLGGEIGSDATSPDKRFGPQLHTSCDAVPVALSLVGNAVAVLSDTYIFDAIIHADGYLIVVTWAEEGGDIVLVGNAEAHLMTNFFAVYKECGLDMRPFQIECDLPALPRTGYADDAAIGGLAHKVTCRSEEEGELHLAGLAVALHIRIEVVGGVIERAGPASTDGHFIANSVGEGGAWKGHCSCCQAGLQLPRAGEVNDILGCGIATAYTKKEGKNNTFHGKSQSSLFDSQFQLPSLQSPCRSGESDSRWTGAGTQDCHRLSVVELAVIHACQLVAIVVAR